MGQWLPRDSLRPCPPDQQRRAQPLRLFLARRRGPPELNETVANRLERTHAWLDPARAIDEHQTRRIQPIGVDSVHPSRPVRGDEKGGAGVVGNRRRVGYRDTPEDGAGGEVQGDDLALVGQEETSTLDVGLDPDGRALPVAHRLAVHTTTRGINREDAVLARDGEALKTYSSFRSGS